MVDRRVQVASLRRIKSSDLRDIGLIEHDISAADQLPLSADVATALLLAQSGSIWELVGQALT